MKLTVYLVDAFAENVFEGNPAAVVPLTEWLPDATMQKMAMEHNLSETAFFVPEDNCYHIRWFTPEAEVDLCGHATLAASHVMFHYLNYTAETITFKSRSGELSVKKEGELLVLNFPASIVEAKYIPTSLKTAFGIHPQKCFKGRDDLMLIFKSEDDIINLKPDFSKIQESTARGIICTAKSEKYDFVSRFFAPAVGVNEDPVTGSAHTMLIPYWAKQLNKKNMVAKQLSKRGGVLECRHLNNRVEIGGKAKTYLVGEIEI
ncbi:PhzF family phenazine biosynthesis protein [Draconibacterium sp. IB214405]|uniref:PhzF family phenazine biosynthesis protein n=1 Tax=Draconibacterium sp. IB214405 TaxID=3097352 RepID=UPI002A1833CD|nr:PhzF family phenazine biosynthesis protein [Draconibacterium sp. IB214405]MDX8339337.1 PhzF family phenazine biosynthesis protein [Draconibacterium sp. IB214405]